jgi:competence protein ComFB
MVLKNKYDFDTLVNEAERLVIEEMEKQLEGKKNEDACLCEDCILDIAALALNNTRPLYRVSLLGSLYAGALDRSEYMKEIGESVLKAIERVKSNPSHE